MAYGGDLNKIFYNKEKKDGPCKSHALIDSFTNYFMDNDRFEFGFLDMNLLGVITGKRGKLLRNGLTYFVGLLVGLFYY